MDAVGATGATGPIESPAPAVGGLVAATASPFEGVMQKKRSPRLTRARAAVEASVEAGDDSADAKAEAAEVQGPGAAALGAPADAEDPGAAPATDAAPGTRPLRSGRGRAAADSPAVSERKLPRGRRGKAG